MRKYLLLLSMVIIGQSLCAQSVDSFALKQVDSLIKISDELFGKEDYEKAKEVIGLAENIAIEKISRESVEYGKCCHNHARIFDAEGNQPEAVQWYLKASEIWLLVVGRENKYYINTRHNLSLVYQDLGDYDKALELQLEIKPIIEKMQGILNPDYIECLINIASNKKLLTRYAEAEDTYLEALDIQIKTAGKTGFNYMSLLNSLADLYTKMSAFNKAEPLYIEVLELLRSDPESSPNSISIILNNLAILYTNMGDFSKAEGLYEEVKDIRSTTFGIEHPYYGMALLNLAVLYLEVDQYEKVNDYLKEARRIFENSVGKESVLYIRTLGVEGRMHQAMANYEEAESIFLELRDLLEATVGVNHQSYADNLTSIGNINFLRGNFSKAELMFTLSASITENLMGKNSHAYAGELKNRGLFRWKMGSYEKAVSDYLEGMAIDEALYGREHTVYADDLYNLGNLYQSESQYEKAEPMQLEAMAIREKMLGIHHPDYASSLAALGMLYTSMGKYDLAENYSLMAKELTVELLGNKHPDYARGLANLGILYKKMARYDQAIQALKESRSIREEAFGKTNSDVAENLMELGQLYWKTHEIDSAGMYFAEANAVQKVLLLNSALHLSEQELSAYSETFASQQNLIYSFFGRQKTGGALAYDNTLFQKGFLMSAVVELKKLAVADSLSKEKYYQLNAYRRVLASELSKSLESRKSIDLIEAKANELEKDLARSVDGFAAISRQVGYRDIQSKLKQGEAAIEFIRYRVNRPEVTDSIMYAALVLKPNDTEPLFIPLFEEGELLSQLSNQNATEKLSQLYTSRGFVPEGAPALSGLYKIIWEPLESELKGYNSIYYSPSGLLHKINFDAIPVGTLTKLADQYHLQRLNSTRSLVFDQEIEMDLNRDVVLFGGIDYDSATTSISILVLESDTFRTENTSIASDLFASRGTSNLSQHWPYLSGTDREVSEIEKQLKHSHFICSTYKHANATEDALKGLGLESMSPRIVHIATHGFFFPDPKSQEKSEGPANTQTVFQLSENPLMRSGLLFAGSNYAWQNNQPQWEGKEDGILTAYEISQLNLSNTELVILSACETGLGDIQGNEGVYGLQRAFKIAGAKYLMMSLWQVPDEETKEFMIDFYRNWLQGEFSIPEAFRATQLEMRSKYENPYLWAGFVLVE